MQVDDFGNFDVGIFYMQVDDFGDFDVGIFYMQVDDLGDFDVGILCMQVDDIVNIPKIATLFTYQISNSAPLVLVSGRTQQTPPPPSNFDYSPIS